MLKNTRCYLIGAMDRTENGRQWRETMQNFLESMGVQVFNPYSKPTDRAIENAETLNLRKKFVEEENWDKVSRIMKEIRRYDLRMVDLSDFVVVYLNMDDKPFGTIYEMNLANQQRKPVLVVSEGGKKNAPLWLFAEIPHKYIFDNFEDLKTYLIGVNHGMDSENPRWKVFQFPSKASKKAPGCPINKSEGQKRVQSHTCLPSVLKWLLGLFK